jgi:fumarate reductase subunit D
MFGDVSSLTGVALSLPFMVLLLGVLIRLGLLSAATALTVHHLLAHTFMTTQLTAWYADSAVAGILATLALAAWGFYAATARSLTAARQARTP